MTVLECIRKTMDSYGTISTRGAKRFARRLGLDPTGLVDVEASTKVENGISEFFSSAIMHPTSVSENGFSQSWSEGSVKRNAMFMLRQYDITPNDELLADMGISMIRDVSNVW